MGLTGAQRKHVRGLAHAIRPLVQVGKEGVTENLVQALDDALDAHEVVKIRFVAEKERAAKTVMVAALEQRCRAECVGTVGHMAIFFRRHPDPEHQKIRLVP